MWIWSFDALLFGTPSRPVSRLVVSSYTVTSPPFKLLNHFSPCSPAPMDQATWALPWLLPAVDSEWSALIPNICGTEPGASASRLQEGMVCPSPPTTSIMTITTCLVGVSPSTTVSYWEIEEPNLHLSTRQKMHVILTHRKTIMVSEEYIHLY